MNLLELEFRDYSNTLPSPLRETTEIVLGNPRFWIAPASSDDPNSGHKHHAYQGGLAAHTLEVLEAALGMYDNRANVTDDMGGNILIAAAIWHDFAKIHEYKIDDDPKSAASELLITITKTPYKNLIRHVAGSYAEFLNAARATNLAQSHPEVTERIGHAILAHHGLKEWGSPVEPQTEEAFILHSADMWSCRYGHRRDRP